MKGSSWPELRGRLWLLRNVNPFLEWASKTLAPAAWLQGREIVFQHLVHRTLDRLGIDAPFYPLRGAANYSYLYLLVRIAEELPVKRLLELGCGQSTLLLDRLAKRNGIECVTLEHDREWLEHISARLEHVQLVHSPLVKKRILGHLASAYDAGAIVDTSADTSVDTSVDTSAGQPLFDVLLVDGPQGRCKRSRWGALEFIERGLGDDFLIVFDDAERRGEQQTIARALKLLDTLGRRYQTLFVRSATSQFLIAGGRLSPARYF